ncbi:hypothetical protein SEA_MEDIUMFRY_42 [Arthrobacter phage MediumFry]|nr:hypothetical protein SEA_MEDIUMFRY_42 [Arthrobacter phage MediumFry]
MDISESIACGALMKERRQCLFVQNAATANTRIAQNGLFIQFRTKKFPVLAPTPHTRKQHNMIKKTLTFKNFRGETETEDFYFNMSEGELTLMQVRAIDQKNESFSDKLDKISKGLQGAELADVIEDLVLRSYGIKSSDGKKFRKNPDILEDFTSSGAYSVLITELFSIEGSLTEFINLVVPEDLVKKSEAEAQKQVSARERALAAKGGYNQKQEKAEKPAEVVHSPAAYEPTLPAELPASAPVLETTPEATPAQVDLNSLSKEELVAMAQRQQGAVAVV